MAINKLRASAWATGTLATVFAVAIAGTYIGDHAVRALHGGTQAEHEAICVRNFEKMRSEDPSFTISDEKISGCAAEKRRGYQTSARIHTTIQKDAGAGLAVLVPLSAGLLWLSRRKDGPR